MTRPRNEQQTRAYVRRHMSPDGTGCVLWVGPMSPTGYGRLRDHTGRTWLAHRYVYAVMGPGIPPGLTIDHLCRRRACVALAHLQPVSNAENVRRAWDARRERGPPSRAPPSTTHDMGPSTRLPGRRNPGGRWVGLFAVPAPRDNGRGTHGDRGRADRYQPLGPWEGYTGRGVS